jgi:hypothetical protein
MRRSSALWALVFTVVTGGMGILAGYGALRLWQDRQQAAAGDNLAKQTPTPTPAHAPASAPAPTPPPRAAQPAPADERKSNKSANKGNRAASQPTKAAKRPKAPEPAEPQPQVTPPSPTTTTSVPPSEAASKSLPQHVVDLDLTRNRQQQAIDAPSKDLRIADLEGCDVVYELKPETITLKGARDIVLAVTLEALPSGKTRISLEPVVTTGAGKKLPFTVRNMENVRRQLGQTGKQATNELAGMKLEKKNLEAYLQSAARRTPAQDTAARARVDQLTNLIPVAEKALKAMQAEYDIAVKMSELAESLNDKCRILLEENTPSAK